MPGLADVFHTLNELEHQNVIERYAVAGAMAFLFYTEPARTYDLDVFVFLPPQAGLLISMQPMYKELESRGYSFNAEHVMMHGTPVQFLPVYNDLAEESVDQAVTHDYDGVSVRVISAEHLVALALQTGGEHRRVRAEALIESGKLDTPKLNKIFVTHGIDRKL